jgi:hypothetical protein
MTCVQRRHDLAGADLFGEKNTAGLLLVAGLFWEKSTAGRVFLLPVPAMHNVTSTLFSPSFPLGISIA